MNDEPGVLIRGGTLVPMLRHREWFAGDLLVRGGNIAAVGSDLPVRESDAVIDARDCLVLPGFVQCHVHVVQSLARHRADGLSLLDWLTLRIWPYEAALTAAEARTAAELGIGELLATGTTTALDMGTVHHQNEVFAAAADLGIRFVSGKCHMDTGENVPAQLLEDSDTSLAEAEALGGRWHGSHRGRLRYAVAPRFALSCTAQLLRGSAELARSNGWLIHTHASENASETELVRTMTGKGNVGYLADLGLTGEDTVLAHCVHLDEDEFDLMAAGGTAVAHCPGANLKLASGIADLPRLLAKGIRTGIGADGPPCNNRLSMFHEMALAGTLHNLRHGADAVDPWTVLALATCRGAEVLGLHRVGRLLAGWAADVIVLAPDAWAMTPGIDPAAMIVYGATPGIVRHVTVDGVVVVRDGELVTGDGASIRSRARSAAKNLARRLEWS